MDTETNSNSNVKDKTNKNHNEETKKMDTDDTDRMLNDVCRQMSKLADAEEDGDGSNSSTDSDDLVNAINYNTITSLAALKDIIQGDGVDTPETDSFFQHYFMNHCNNLSSRNSNTNVPYTFPERRRLSQCREEDEDDERKESDPPPSIVSSGEGSEVTSLGSISLLNKERETSETIIDNNANVSLDLSPGEGNKEHDPSKRTVMGAKHKFLVTTAEPPPREPDPAPAPTPLPPVQRALLSHIHNAHTVHFGTKGVEEQRPSVRALFLGQNLHRDKHYFDSKLIEIRSTVDGMPTSSEDIWVKRTDEKQVDKEDLELKKPEKKKSSVEEKKPEPVRVRSGTWGSQSTGKDVDSIKKKQPNKDKEVRRSSDERRQKREQRLDAAVTRSSQSVSERKRRGSNDDGQPDARYQQTIHGTSGVSRRPALFDIFKSKSRGDAAKKPPSIMQQVRAAVQSMTKSTPVKEQPKVEGKQEPVATSSGTPVAKARDGSAHPHPGSDTRYYHTVTAASGTRRPSAMAKVMDIFRGRASMPGQTIPIETAEKRKADGNISNEKNHKCKPNEVKNSMVKEINKLRETVLKSNFTPIPKIYNTFKSQFSEAEPNLVKIFPTFKNLKTNLYVARNKDAGVSKIKCKSVDEVEIPSQFRDFVLYDYEDESNTRIIILAHPNQLTQMAKIKVYQCDGTFQCCTPPFLQLYSIHGDFGSDEEHTRMVPLIYVLLNSKTEKTYKTLFEILKQNIPGWEPSKFMTDFEQAAMNAISTVFPSVEVKGCYFHFSKNVWKEAKDLHLTKDAITRRHVRLSSLLPLLPRDLISEGWCYIMEDSPETGAIEAFNNYMVSQWLEDESFVDTWCVFSERHRTTNPVESWHMKLNSTVPKNANLYQLLKALKEDADLQSVVTKQYKTNAPNAKRRATETIVKNRWIKHVTNQLLEKKISVGHCLEKLRL